MCGIAGICQIDATPLTEAGQWVKAMTDRMAHRGPDGEGQWEPRARVPGAQAAFHH